MRHFFIFYAELFTEVFPFGKNIGLKAIRQILYHFHKRSAVTSIVLEICAELWNF